MSHREHQERNDHYHWALLLKTRIIVRMGCSFSDDQFESERSINVNSINLRDLNRLFSYHNRLCHQTWMYFLNVSANAIQLEFKLRIISLNDSNPIQWKNITTKEKAERELLQVDRLVSLCKKSAQANSSIAYKTQLRTEIKRKQRSNEPTLTTPS